MFAIIAGLIILGGIILAIIHRDGEIIMYSLFVSMMSAMIVGLVIDLPVNAAMRERVDYSYDLATLNDGSKTQGSFFLGSGTIDSVPSFMYYMQDGDGYVLRDWPASSSRVVETDGEPRAVYKCYDYSTVPRPFRWASQMMEDGKTYDCDHASVTFYVPPGSVKREVTLDAQ